MAYIHIPVYLQNFAGFFFKIKSRDEMEKRTETGLVMGHAYGVTAVKKVCMSLGLKHF